VLLDNKSTELKWEDFWRVFGGSPVQTSAETPIILTEDFHGFLASSRA
jgi:hypothetical protein